MAIFPKIIIILFIIDYIGWNIIMIFDIKETIQWNKARDPWIEQAKIKDSSFWCLVFDSILVMCAIVYFLDCVR